MSQVIGEMRCHPLYGMQQFNGKEWTADFNSYNRDIDEQKLNNDLKKLLNVSLEEVQLMMKHFYPERTL